MENVILHPISINARVAELVDAADSKSAVRKDVLVRFQSRAPEAFHSNGRLLYLENILKKDA